MRCSTSRPTGKLPPETKDLVFLTEEGVVQYEAPRWSPDGSKIAVSVWQPGGYKDIWILDAEGKKLEEVTHDRAIDGAPAWSPDGKYLYFSSDRTGIFNLFACELETKKLFQITNVLGGAFSPDPSPDDKSLSSRPTVRKATTSIRMPVDGRPGSLPSRTRTSIPLCSTKTRPFETATKPYNPLPTLAPRFWLPWFGYSYESGTLGGFFTFGQDAVQRHAYVVSGLYGPKDGRIWYSLDYLYDGLYPTIHLSCLGRG